MLKLLGEIALKQGRMVRAEEIFKRCVELAPDFVAARFRYATVLMTQNKPQEAIDQVDEILKVEDDPYHRNLKAAALIRMSDFENAAVEYAIMLKAFPNQPAPGSPTAMRSRRSAGARNASPPTRRRLRFCPASATPIGASPISRPIASRRPRSTRCARRSRAPT